MRRSYATPGTLASTNFHLVPAEESVRARQNPGHPDNDALRISMQKAGMDDGNEDKYRLETGCHVSARPRPQVIVKVRPECRSDPARIDHLQNPLLIWNPPRIPPNHVL